MYTHIHHTRTYNFLPLTCSHTKKNQTNSTLKGHRPDVGDMCIPGEFNLKGSSTLSSRSTDQGFSPHFVVLPFGFS